MKYLKHITNSQIILLTIVWQVLLTFQGLDLADTGFHLCAFRFITTDPYSVQYSMMFWLSDICGALWMKLFPGGGLYWMKLGWVLVSTGTFLTYRRLLLNFTANKHLLIVMAITLIFILRGGPECLNYDLFTTLGYGLGLLLLTESLLRPNRFLLFLSGLIFGISLFFKLSNICSSGFLLLIPFYGAISRCSRKTIVLNTGSWIAGFISGVVLILLLIQQWGHWHLFSDNISFLISMGSDHQSSHGMIPMLFSYFPAYSNAIIMLTLFLIATVILSKLYKRHPNFFSQRNQTIFFILLASGLSLLQSSFPDPVWSKIRYLFIGLMLAYGIYQSFNVRTDRKIRLLAFTGLLLLLITPLGSDSNLEKSVWGMWITGPMVLLAPFPFCHPKQIALPKELTSFLQKTFAILILTSGLIYAWQHTYFDTRSRLCKTHALEHPDLKLIYTSGPRAKVMNEMIQEGLPRLKNHNYLLSFIEIPLFNYLSDKRPFISTSWPKLYYNPETFRKKLAEAVSLRKHLPAIIRQKQATKLNNWPSDRPTPDNNWPGHNMVLNEFIACYNYQVVWENEMFEILLSTDMK